MALDDMTSPQEEKNKQRGMVVSIILHITLVALALLPLFTYPDPPPGQEGILVNLGLPDQGQGFENAGPAEPLAEADPLPEPETEEAPPIEEVPEEPEPEPVPDPEPAPQKEVVETEDPEQIALRREEERKRREAEAAARAERERQRREEEARRKAEAERQRRAEEANKLKDQIGGLFGSGEGKGETGKEGNQGDEDGDPNAQKLEGISTGAGQVGGGLSDRGVLRAPRPQDASQQTGRVVIEVCVDINGNITRAEYTQRGSTTANAELVNIAVTNARKWKFSKGEVERQCGTITYNFRVR